MSDKSGIEWTQATWNPVTGCTKVSQGCKHCYAERAWCRLSKNPKLAKYFGREFTDVQCHPDTLDQPLRWKKPRRIFVNSMSDLFHEDVPDNFIDDVFVVMHCSPQHVFQVLTKRPDRMWKYFERDRIEFDITDPLPNVWLGVSVEDQATADERIPMLLDTPAAVRWLSIEPLLGPIDLSAYRPFCRKPIPAEMQQYLKAIYGDSLPANSLNAKLSAMKIGWCVVGGESGPKARPMHPNWVSSIRDQCQAAGVPLFFKQWGEWAPVVVDALDPSILHVRGQGEFTKKPEFHYFDDATVMACIGKKAAGHLLDGHEWSEYPA